MELSFYVRSWTLGYSCADITRDFSQPSNKHIHQLEAIASQNQSENSICFYEELFVSIMFERSSKPSYR